MKIFENLLKDCFRDISRALSAWLNTTESGRVFQASFKQAFLEAGRKAAKRVDNSIRDYNR
jgi:hypothetical protein